MANIAGSYDENAEVSGDFSPIPVNNYRAKIIQSGIEEISKNDDKGRCLALTWQIETGPYDGRLVWQRLNLWPKNFKSKKPGKTDSEVMDEAVKIANSEFASIRQATGKIAPQDSSELEHIACDIYVGLSKPQPGYAPKNEVKSVKAVAGSGQAAAPQQRQAPPAQQQRQTPPPANNGGRAGSLPWNSRQTA